MLDPEVNTLSAILLRLQYTVVLKSPSSFLDKQM